MSKEQLELIRAINLELERMHDFQEREGQLHSDEFYELVKPLHNALIKLTSTTEGATQTDRVGEQCSDDRVVAVERSDHDGTMRRF